MLRKKKTMIDLASEPRKIPFRSDDNIFQRAANIWEALGFANDRRGCVAQIAGFLSLYKDLDEKSACLRKEAFEKERNLSSCS